MNIPARVNISHIDSSEHHEIYKDGEFELIEREDGTYLVQIILGDWCAAAVLNKEAFEDALMEDAGMESIGHIGGETIYGVKEQEATPDEWGVFKCDECGKDVPVGEEKRVSETGPILCAECYEKAPTPSEDEDQNFTCEDCGAEIPAGHERRMKDGDTILCGECAKKHPDDYFL